MTDYLNDAFNDMTKDFRKLILQYDDDIVVGSLVRYYDLVSKPDKVDNSSDVLEPDYELMAAIDRVLQDYMQRNQYEDWCKSRSAKG